MQYQTLSDTELRRVLDNAPTAGATAECVRRFIHGSDEVAALREELASAEAEIRWLERQTGGDDAE